jgi:hypothetical protein
MKLKKCLVVISFTLLFSSFSYSQDVTLTWTGFDLTIPIDSKSQLDIKPIVRHNLNGDGYQNLSVDLFYKRKFNNGYFGQILGRTWYLKEATYRQFLWLDVGKVWKFEKFNLTQKFRLHYAIDISDNFDGDFLRSFTVLGVPLGDKLSASFNIEPWLSLNDDIEISRLRIEPGLKWKISDQLGLSMVYRRQIESVSANNQNHIVTTLGYKLDRMPAAK